MAEQMTLERVRDIMSDYIYPSTDYVNGLSPKMLQQWIDAIDAHLNAAKGEAVAWWCAIESVEAIDGTEEIAMSWNADDGNAGEAARTEANQWINDQPHPGNFHLAKVYTNPASPDAVRDAGRYRIVRNYYGVDLDDSDRRVYHDALDRQLDKDINEFGAKAMAAREGGE